jgi:voltage-gated potassium channel
VTLRRKLTISIISVFGVVSFGTIGYSIIEQWGLFDSLYMTVITLTTVGFEEVHSLSKTGKLFTIILILLGVGAFLYALKIG